jgi:hypothetical protein
MGKYLHGGNSNMRLSSGEIGNFLSLELTNTIKSGRVVRDIVRVLQNHYHQLEFLDLSSIVTEFDPDDAAEIATAIGEMPVLRTFLLKDVKTIKEKKEDGTISVWNSIYDGTDLMEGVHKHVQSAFLASVMKSTTLSRLQIPHHFGNYNIGYYALRNRCWRWTWQKLNNSLPAGIWAYVLSQPARWLQWWQDRQYETEELIKTPIVWSCYDTMEYIITASYNNDNGKQFEAEAIFTIVTTMMSYNIIQ